MKLLAFLGLLSYFTVLVVAEDPILNAIRFVNGDYENPIEFYEPSPEEHLPQETLLDKIANFLNRQKEKVERERYNVVGVNKPRKLTLQYTAFYYFFNPNRVSSDSYSEAFLGRQLVDSTLYDFDSESSSDNESDGSKEHKSLRKIKKGPKGGRPSKPGGSGTKKPPSKPGGGSIKCSNGKKPDRYGKCPLPQSPSGNRRCPGGQKKLPNGKCPPSPGQSESRICRNGQIRLPNGKCPLRPGKCPRGQKKLPSGQCSPSTGKCPRGQNRLSNGKCPPRPGKCPRGQKRQPDGKCAPSQRKCLDGQIRQPNGKCPPRQGGRCQNGQKPDRNGKCPNNTRPGDGGQDESHQSSGGSQQDNQHGQGYNQGKIEKCPTGQSPYNGMCIRNPLGLVFDSLTGVGADILKQTLQDRINAFFQRKEERAESERSGVPYDASQDESEADHEKDMRELDALSKPPQTEETDDQGEDYSSEEDNNDDETEESDDNDTESEEDYEENPDSDDGDMDIQIPDIPDININI